MNEGDGTNERTEQTKQNGKGAMCNNMTKHFNAKINIKRHNLRLQSNKRVKHRDSSLNDTEWMESEWERESDEQRLERLANFEIIRPVQPKISSEKEIEMLRLRMSLPAHGIFVYLQNISATLGVGCQKCYAKSPKRWVLNLLQTKIWTFLFLSLSLWQLDATRASKIASG